MIVLKPLVSLQWPELGKRGKLKGLFLILEFSRTLVVFAASLSVHLPEHLLIPWSTAGGNAQNVREFFRFWPANPGKVGEFFSKGVAF